MAKDPYRYYRIEARELLEGMSAGLLALERGEADPEQVRTLLRLAHTLKGASRVVRQEEIARLAHSIEDLLAPLRDDPQADARQAADQAMVHLSAVEGLLGALDAPPAPSTPPSTPPPTPAPTHPTPTPRPTPKTQKPPTPPPPAASGSAGLDESLRSVRVDVEELDRVSAELAEVAARLQLLQAQVAADPAVAAALGGVERALRESGRRMVELRMVPAETIFGLLQRTVRDAARATGRDVRLDCVGGAHRLDANILLVARDALAHIVRNAVVHGVESPDLRARRGKPATARVRLSVSRPGDQVCFTCNDDGGGIDVQAVARAALATGRITAAQAAELDLDGAVSLLLAGGTSTAEQVDQVAGRGVGLEQLQATALRLGGRVTIQSQPDAGTTVALHLPVSRSSMVALVVRAGDVHACLPLGAVTRTVQLEPGSRGARAGREVVELDGRTMRLTYLGALLGSTRGTRVAGRAVAAIVSVGGQEVAVEVDEIVGVEPLVIRPVPALAPAHPLVAGIAVDALGRPRLVLEAEELVGVSLPAGSGRDPAPAPTPPILVIDDSLTTRMLEQSILESAGYEVDVAVSAEEGLEKAQARRYGLFVVDVEMPGMSGYDFVSLTRQDPAFRDIPAILVTSLASESDRRRGYDAGAAAYITKGEFDQRFLLATISSLMGGP